MSPMRAKRKRKAARRRPKAAQRSRARRKAAPRGTRRPRFDTVATVEDARGFPYAISGKKTWGTPQYLEAGKRFYGVPMVRVREVALVSTLNPERRAKWTAAHDREAVRRRRVELAVIARDVTRIPDKWLAGRMRAGRTIEQAVADWQEQERLARVHQGRNPPPLPSEKIGRAAAKRILARGTVHGRPLSPAQRTTFAIAAHRKNPPPLRSKAPKWLDDFSRGHLERWALEVHGRYARFVLRTIWTYLDRIDTADREYAIGQGWGWVSDQALDLARREGRRIPWAP